MKIEEEISKILELWNNIKPKAKGDLASLWEEKEELGELDALVEDLEPKVIKLLEVIHTSPRHSLEYHARTRDLVKLLNHFNKSKSSAEWIQKVTSDLDFICTEARKAINEAVRIRSAAPSAQIQAKSVDVEIIDSLKKLIIRIKKGLADLESVMPEFSRIAQEYSVAVKSHNLISERASESKLHKLWGLATDKIDANPSFLNLDFLDELRKIFGSVFGFAPADKNKDIKTYDGGRENLTEHYKNELNHIPEVIRSPYHLVVEGLLSIKIGINQIMSMKSSRPYYEVELIAGATRIVSSKAKISPQLDILEAYFNR